MVNQDVPRLRQQMLEELKSGELNFYDTWYCYNNLFSLSQSSFLHKINTILALQY